MASLPNYTNPAPPSAHEDEEADNDETTKVEFRTNRIHRIAGIYGALLLTLICIWVVGYTMEEPNQPPDLSHYVHLKTVSAEFLDLDRPGRRVIMVGDLHGMMHSLDHLLRKIEYNSVNDTLIHLGDVTAKGPHSNELLRRFAKDNTMGVRGNNDQKVLEWYTYFEWVKKSGAERWLNHLIDEDIKPKEFKRLKLGPRLKFPVPLDWEWGGDHWSVARNMTHEDFKYLSSLPIVLHLPSLHTLMVHAGILPIDPTRDIYNRHQPLARLPKKPVLLRDLSNTEEVRNAQELSLLKKIPGNTDPFIKLNMRDVHDGVPMRRGPDDHDDVTPWSEMWNDVIKRCGGFNVSDDVQQVEGVHFQSSFQDDELRKKKKDPLPCHPITVVYSHASTRGLDLKKWSKGLDTGCVDGKGLTAMILGKGRHVKNSKNKKPPIEDPDPHDHNRDVEVRFGEDRHARLVSVYCPMGKEE